MLLTAIIFFVVLGILVFIHELGHFMVAKWIGVRVDEFGFGLPPRMWGKKVGETTYSLNWLPIGGFVRLAGEDEVPAKAKAANLKRYFWARSKKERAAILLAGVVMNFILAVGITSYLLTIGLDEASGKIKIVKVQEDSPAAAANLAVGDIVESVRYTGDRGTDVRMRVRMPRELISIANKRRGKELTLGLIKDGERVNISLIPREKTAENQGAIGIGIEPEIIHLQYPWYQAPWEAVKLNVKRAGDIVYALSSLPLRLLEREDVSDEVAGPLRIAKVTGEAAKLGFDKVLNLMSLLSLSLAMFNVLPIPALDGGRFAFVFLEKIIGRKVKPTIENSAHQIGMIVLLAFIFLVSINDVRLLLGGW